MTYFTDRNHPQVTELLKTGAVGVLRTDTLYGIVTSVFHEAAVERLYAVRGRERNKACILLISDERDMFDIPPEQLREVLKTAWPGPVSVVVPAPSAPGYLPKVDGTLAYRLPADAELRELLRHTGPLLAPSANLAGQPPAKNIAAAKAYFGDKIDFYTDSGEVSDSAPSQILKLEPSGAVVRLR
ncbi:MAG TPA: L-threonylcarbamoyladenylate synthase [Verrucomicrobiae bacterium]|nr:L-threonylcarbamoyladenylate synthase [Verrucomicrobiae bacterium]